MKKIIFPILFLAFAVSAQTSFASSEVQGMTACFDQGYEKGVQYYKTGDKSLIKFTAHPCCSNPQSPRCNTYQVGVGYVIQYGPTKTYQYDEIKHGIRMMELIH